MALYKDFDSLIKDVIKGKVELPNEPYIPPITVDKDKLSITDIKNQFIDTNEHLSPELKYRINMVVNIFLQELYRLRRFYFDRHLSEELRVEYITNSYDNLDYYLDLELINIILNKLEENDILMLDLILCIIDNRVGGDEYIKLVKPFIKKIDTNTIYLNNNTFKLTYVMKYLKDF